MNTTLLYTPSPPPVVFPCDITNNHTGVQRSATGKHYRVIPVIAGRGADGSPRYKSGGIRRCDEHGRIIPRVRMSKKDRILHRNFAAAMNNPW